MTPRIVAQRELPGGVQEIVAVDAERGVTDVLQRPMTVDGQTWTFQAPKTLYDGRLMAYRLKPGEQFNLASASNELCIFAGPDSPTLLPRPTTKAGWGRNAITWAQHGHAAPTERDTLIHAVNELESWWLFGWPVRKQWVCIETDLSGKPTGARWPDQAEPSWGPHGLTRISTAGTGAIVTPFRSFDKATSPIGAKSFGWFDPHLSPDGSTVVWLDLVSIGLGVTSGLIVGDIQTGRVRYLVTPTLQMQTDAMWLDNRTLIGAQYLERHWHLVRIDAVTGRVDRIPSTVDCTAVHVDQLA